MNSNNDVKRDVYSRQQRIFFSSPSDRESSQGPRSFLSNLCWELNRVGRSSWPSIQSTVDITNAWSLTSAVTHVFKS